VSLTTQKHLALFAAIDRIRRASGGDAFVCRFLTRLAGLAAGSVAQPSTSFPRQSYGRTAALALVSSRCAQSRSRFRGESWG
jgi:hypothetical protein